MTIFFSRVLSKNKGENTKITSTPNPLKKGFIIVINDNAHNKRTLISKANIICYDSQMLKFPLVNVNAQQKI